ncbi:hypothetical protein [Embleya hyalina]|uniref:ACT domain-containing protein n=1 Tax=Embleya hyalina TaxID=516124 RepID=A0A401Z0B5_9ACTN|nr:hypothetical protein [Embleya hyalina]GCE00251.1 hypothetical protein EHYA_07976 [Embleya hyalina]
MVDDGAQVLDVARYVPPARPLGPPDRSRTADPEIAHLVARMRHHRGSLARVATVLNNHGVHRLTYTSTDLGAATVEVSVHPRDAARVEARLRRLVEVTEVTRLSAD